jgi:hypothetical protein
MKKEDYMKKAKYLAGLLYLAIKNRDFSKTNEYLQEIKQAIDDMRKQS